MKKFVAFLSILLMPAIAHATMYSYAGEDGTHGSASPPPYGLRLDNLFSGSGISGTTTFTFDDPVYSNVRVDLDDVAKTLRIHGTVRGGLDNNNTGSGYTANADVQASIDFKFINVTFPSTFDPADPGIVIPSGTGSGSITIDQDLGSTTALAGNTYDLTHKANGGGNIFNFVGGGHRGNPGINGWGWLRVTGGTAADGSSLGPVTLGSGQYNDWLFGATIVPEASTVVGWSLMGLVGSVVVWRRRRI